MCGLQDFFVYNTDELNIYWSLSSSVWIQVIYVRQMTSESPGWSVCVWGGVVYFCVLVCTLMKLLCGVVFYGSGP